MRSITASISRERPVSSVPRTVIAVLVLSLFVQAGYHHFYSVPEADETPLSAPPEERYLNALSLGEPVAFSRFLMLWLQAFDYQPGVSVSFARLDYDHVIGWLDRILFLDPATEYPLLSAARIYSEVADDEKKRQMLDFVYRKFLDAPELRWQWLAHAVYVAKHKLHDLELALEYARALRLNTSSDSVPDWAWQMELFVLEDLGDAESARILLGGLIESGEITDPRQIEFLTSRLDEE